MTALYRRKLRKDSEETLNTALLGVFDEELLEDYEDTSSFSDLENNTDNYNRDALIGTEEEINVFRKGGRLD